MRLRRLREAGEFVMRIKMPGAGCQFRVSGAKCQVSGKSVAEWEVLLDAIFVGAVDKVRAPQAAAAFRAFGLAEVAPAGAIAQDLASGGYLEPLAHGLFG